jgi:hypothetical protein
MADACLLGSGRRLVLYIDRFEAAFGDAKGYRSAVVIAPPDRERATGPDLLQQAGAHELIDNLAGDFASAGSSTPRIIALRSRG